MSFRFQEDWFSSVGLPSLQKGQGVHQVSSSLKSLVPQLVRQAIDVAIEAGASDLHFEPGPDQYALRVRHNGTLLAEEKYEPELQPRITTHIKALADLDITEKRRPQDGRIRWANGGGQVDIRVSTVPGAHGEKTVLRLLDPSKLPESLAGLGMDGRTRAALETAAERSRGLILVTGPTGSGKSTTLYTLLKSTDRDQRNVMTVEDPVEYELAGVTQVAVDTKVNRTFASVLRSFLRQDPDVLLVGEVRDLETAEICIRASLTGHLVLSTLHTNDAVGSILRMLDMGIPPYLLADSLSLVCSQRLLRTLCPHCIRDDPAGLQILAEYDLSESISNEPRISAGCEKCRGTGVSGRTGIYETLIVSSSIQEAIRNNASSARLDDIARSEGLVPLLDQGLDLVNRGMVAAQEVLIQVLTAGSIGKNHA